MEVDKKILSILKKNFKNLKIKKNISDLKLEKIKGWDSLKHFHLLLQIEEAFNLRFSTSSFTKIKSIKDIIIEVKKHGKKK